MPFKIDTKKYDILMEYIDIDEITKKKTIYYIIKRKKSKMKITINTDGSILIKKC